MPKRKLFLGNEDILNPTATANMVIFGGLELVAAGYLLHEHAKHKEERARAEEEEAALERRRRRRHSADRRRRHSDERRHSQSYEYEDIKPSRPSRPSRPSPRPSPRPQHLSPNRYPAASPYLAPPAQPARANSAPPPQQQQDPYYPPTGWPQHWPQSQRPDPNAGPSRSEAGPLPPKYGWRPDQDHLDTNNYPSPRLSPAAVPAQSSRRRSRGRSESRPAYSPAQGAGRTAYSQQPVGSPHVRFSLPDDRAEPPPAYSR